MLLLYPFGLLLLRRACRYSESRTRSSSQELKETQAGAAWGPIQQNKLPRTTRRNFHIIFPFLTFDYQYQQENRSGASVSGIFPEAPGLPENSDQYLDYVQEIYVTDAYHSLSIEGYRVSPELIEKVRKGSWNPEKDVRDRELQDSLAARGYWQAYQAVRVSLSRVLSGENAGDVADDDHGKWHRELFAPSVTAGLLRPADLAGYRTAQVFIRHSMHVPPGKDTVRELMPALFDLLREEKDPAVRAVLGHFVFVYIHPYMDGNGRAGRFLMNVMLASGGYPWTIVPITKREQYLKFLEKASVVRQDRYMTQAHPTTYGGSHLRHDSRAL